MLPASVPVAPELVFTVRTRPPGLPSTSTSSPRAAQKMAVPGLLNTEAAPPASPHPAAPLPASVLVLLAPEAGTARI